MLTRRTLLSAISMLPLATSSRALTASEFQGTGDSGKGSLATAKLGNKPGYRQLVGSDLTVSSVALGCNFGGWTSVTNRDMRPIGNKQIQSIVSAAYDAGITFFDTADVYGDGGSEEILGKTLKPNRDKVVIATKWGGDKWRHQETKFGSRQYVRKALEASLRRLRTDYIDLYLMHWPDPLTPIAETLGALDELVAEGKIRHAGCCHLGGWQIADAAWTARTNRTRPFVAIQREYNLLTRSVEVEIVPASQHFESGILAVVPLAGGLLTGKYRRDAPAPEGARLAGKEIGARTFDFLESLSEFAAERGRTVTDVAIGWLTHQPAVAAVIAGATKPEHIYSNAGAMAWSPTADDLRLLNQISDAVVAHKCDSGS